MKITVLFCRPVPISPTVVLRVTCFTDGVVLQYDNTCSIIRILSVDKVAEPDILTGHLVYCNGEQACVFQCGEG
jgi:hypothetical protein